MKNSVLLLLTFSILSGCNDDENTDQQDSDTPVIIDTTDPAAPVIDLDDASDTGRANDDNITSDKTPTFTITNYAVVNKTDRVSVKWFIDGAEQAGETGATFTTSELPDGTYVVTARFIDTAGNFTNSAALSVIIDKTAPAAPVIDLDDASDTGTADDDNITSDRTPTFTITNYKAVTDANNVSVKWFIDGVEQAGETGATFTTSELPDGTYVVTARFIDAAGNFTNSAALSVTIDAAAPTAPVIDLDDASDTGTADDDNITSDRTPTFTITNYKAVTDADDVSVKWFIDGVEQKGETGAIFTTSELSNGTYVVTAQFIDVSGNTGSPNAITVVISDNDNPSDCGCESVTRSTISESENLVGRLYYKTQTSPIDNFYNNHFWINYSHSVGVLVLNVIVCNEDFLSDDLKDLKNLAPGESIEVKFSGDLKETCFKKISPAIYSYNRIVLTSIERK
ncbi:MAG: hypothetical protein GDA51_13375 [Ekhidna sp.]|nr:hypothetical protein [Ekhidna sp.]